MMMLFGLFVIVSTVGAFWKLNFVHRKFFYKENFPEDLSSVSNVTFQEVLCDWNACKDYHLLVLGHSLWKLTFILWTVIEFAQNMGVFGFL
jgi:hypothetical protein